MDWISERWHKLYFPAIEMSMVGVVNLLWLAVRLSLQNQCRSVINPKLQGLNKNQLNTLEFTTKLIDFWTNINLKTLVLGLRNMPTVNEKQKAMQLQWWFYRLNAQ